MVSSYLNQLSVLANGVKYSNHSKRPYAENYSNSHQCYADSNCYNDKDGAQEPIGISRGSILFQPKGSGLKRKAKQYSVEIAEERKRNRRYQKNKPTQCSSLTEAYIALFPKYGVNESQSSNKTSSSCDANICSRKPLQTEKYIYVIQQLESFFFGA